MTIPEPSWAPLAAPPSMMEAALHLRFAITPIGPCLPHLAGGAEPVPLPQAGSAWHELSVAALLVCLMAENTAFTAEPLDLADARLVPTPQDGADWLLPPFPARPEPEPSGPIPAPGMIPDDGWLKLLTSRSGLEAAWPLS